MNDLSIIVRHMRVFAERCMADEGLGFPEQLVIMCLAARKTSNQEQVASYLDIDKGAVAKTVAKLEAKGLVDAQPNEETAARSSCPSRPPDARPSNAWRRRSPRGRKACSTASTVRTAWQSSAPSRRWPAIRTS